MNSYASMIVFGAIFAAMVQYIGAQTVHIVGDSVGWDIPPNSSVSYANWVSGKTFMVGDILVFNFMTNQHDLLQVPKSSYDACSDDNAIGSAITTGPANVTLDSAGEHYYICTFGSHCQMGQKLAITVSGTPGANPPTSSPPTTPTTPSPTSTQPDACAPTPSSTPNAGRPPASATSPAGTPPPPYDSSSMSVFASFLPVLLSIGAALLI
ncbi:cucumber peeling cupredoxin-like [Olea europaea var. sylvestris]|uniref:cucumber peeling cupredoxin-like n=1 Tax=Olea europaea var. sylvestris TaxID=158386 RepID=UPI000C1D124C|nr:cucumber peeling cupredoxin-like [Olea europaea var. sylvestris]